MTSRIQKDRPWSEYPIGTKAFAIGGGWWTCGEGGWTWITGDSFPQPGADACHVELPAAVSRWSMDRVHDLKSEPRPFQRHADGIAHHEVRTSDRDYRVGDVLRLREWTPRADSSVGAGDYSGREVWRRVVDMTPGGSWGLPRGICVLSTAPMAPSAEATDDRA